MSRHVYFAAIFGSGLITGVAMADGLPWWIFVMAGLVYVIACTLADALFRHHSKEESDD